MALIEDKAQKADKHELKHIYLAKMNIELMRYPLPVGDYILLTDKVQDVIDRKTKRGTEVKKMDFLGTYDKAVDTKYSVSELAQDLVQDHDRFRDECILAQNNGIELIILVENEDGITDLDGLQHWENPRAKWYWINKAKKRKVPPRPPVGGKQLYKAACTMQEKYDVKFLFCTPWDAGKTIIELLGG